MTSSTSLVTLCALLGATVRSGLDVRSALDEVGRVADGDADSLSQVAAALSRGVGWDEAWTRAPGRLAPLARALLPAWERGASPVEALESLAEASLARAKAAGEAAGAELGVRLSLPLALCLLPAFVLVGIVPLLIAIGGSVVGSVGVGDVVGGGP